MDFTFDVVIFDLDGTLSNHEHRNHLTPGKGDNDDGDWDAFTLASENDSPYPLVCTLARALYPISYRFEIWTGRGSIARESTIKWLKCHDIKYDNLLMRDIGDATMDSKLKHYWYKKRPFDERDVIVFEDRKRCVDMWRKMGVRCFQTQPGDF